jgi:hypothetical protein
MGQRLRMVEEGSKRVRVGLGKEAMRADLSALRRKGPPVL